MNSLESSSSSAAVILKAAFGIKAPVTRRKNRQINNDFQTNFMATFIIVLGVKF